MSTPEPCWAAAYGPGVPLHLEAGDTTLVDRFERTASAHPQRVALEFLGRKTTYAAMADQVSRVAEGLRRLGVGPGDSVALLMPNCPQNVIAFCAVLRLGATVVEHNPLYTAGELR
ncbi:MAG: AMP-binding protein, partial [Dermatophilaceae bacterium]|nr:AMP-binding protein [Dermatophilaceae bacterium]